MRQPQHGNELFEDFSMQKLRCGQTTVTIIASIAIISAGISTAPAEDNSNLARPKYIGAQVDDPEKNNFGYDSKTPSDLSVRFCNGCKFNGLSEAEKATQTNRRTTTFGPKTGNTEKDTIGYYSERTR